MRRASLFNKKADPETKQYGTPTPVNPMNQQKKDNKDLQIQKPPLPGQPGNAPGNQATNGPMVEQQNPVGVVKEADRTLLPQETTKQIPGAYGYRDISTKALPIAQPPTREQGAAPAWVTGSKVSTNARQLLDRAHTNLLALVAHFGIKDKEVIDLLAEIENFLGIEWNSPIPGHRAKLLNKKARHNPSPYTVEMLRNLLEGCDSDAPVEVVSAVSTYPKINLPVYEAWRNGRSPILSVDTDPFLEHLKKIDYNPNPRWPEKKGGKQADMYQKAPEEEGDWEDLAEGSPVARTIADERRERRQANAELASLGRRYHHSMPIQEIKDILTHHGFDAAAMDGIYTGHEGKMHEQCGPHTWIAMTWHKLERTGLWEIVAYLS